MSIGTHLNATAAALVVLSGLSICSAQVVEEFRNVDPITDAVFEGFTMWSEVDEVSSFAQMTLACSDGEPILGIEFGFTSYPTGVDSLPFTYRFDSDEPLDSEGYVSDPEGAMLLLLDGRSEFVLELFASDRLAIRTRIEDGQEATAVFDLSETRGLLRDLDCFVDGVDAD